jgi:hypothetical protein
MARFEGPGYVTPEEASFADIPHRFVTVVDALVAGDVASARRRSFLFT